MPILNRRTAIVVVSVSSGVAFSAFAFGLFYKLLKFGVGTGEMARAMTKVTFYPTLFYNVAMTKLSSRRWFDRVDDAVLLGAIPFRSSLPLLLEKEGVGAVLTLNEDFELAFSRPWTVQPEEWAMIGVRQLHLRVVDLVAAPTVEQTRRGVEFIKEAKNRGESVYVHCKAGRTRSATIVAAYLMEESGLRPEEAEQFLVNLRSHVSIRRPQKDLLQRYDAFLRSGVVADEISS